MSAIGLSKKSLLLIAAFLLLLSLSLASAYYRYVVLEDYEIYLTEEQL